LQGQKKRAIKLIENQIFLEKAMTWDQIEDKSVELKGRFGVKWKLGLKNTPNRTAGQRRVI
jgi:hypothetical protein